MTLVSVMGVTSDSVLVVTSALLSDVISLPVVTFNDAVVSTDVNSNVEVISFDTAETVAADKVSGLEDPSIVFDVC